MAWPKDRKEITRKKILTSASSLFSRRGYEGVSIGDVMNHAGLTHGAFYAHFDSKQTLYKDAIRYGAAYKIRQLQQQMTSTTSPSNALSIFVNEYLSEEHACAKTPACPLAFLVSDVGIADNDVRQAYTEVYARFLSLMSASSEQSTHIDFARSALMIGGIALARAITDEDARRQLLAACRDAVNSLQQSSLSDGH